MSNGLHQFHFLSPQFCHLLVMLKSSLLFFHTKKAFATTVRALTTLFFPQFIWTMKMITCCRLINHKTCKNEMNGLWTIYKRRHRCFMAGSSNKTGQDRTYIVNPPSLRWSVLKDDDDDHQHCVMEACVMKGVLLYLSYLPPQATKFLEPRFSMIFISSDSSLDHKDIRWDQNPIALTMF
jgi:hypothetical protein